MIRRIVGGVPAISWKQLIVLLSGIKIRNYVIPKDSTGLELTMDVEVRIDEVRIDEVRIVYNIRW